MTTYSIALYFHIVGALGFFAALGLEWANLRRLQHLASTDQVRDWLRGFSGVRRLGAISMLTILVAGFYMMAIAHIDAAWLMVAFGTFILLMLLAMMLTGRWVTAIRLAVTSEQKVAAATLDPLLHHPMLAIGIQIRVAIALGAVFLMTVKPDLTGSLLAVGIAVLLGLASTLPMLSRERVPQKSAS